MNKTLPDCGDWRCSAGRECLGHCAASQVGRQTTQPVRGAACTCLARAMAGHGNTCSGACECGGCAEPPERLGTGVEPALARSIICWVGALLALVVAGSLAAQALAALALA